MESQRHVRRCFSSSVRFEIGPAVRGLAASYTDESLRSLDAIHLATAQVLAVELGGSPVTFVTSDKQLLSAAAGVGLVTASPGA